MPIGACAMRHPAAKTTMNRVIIVIILILPRFLLPLAIPSVPRIVKFAETTTQTGT
jgi:hypothetical protein